MPRPARWDCCRDSDPWRVWRQSAGRCGPCGRLAEPPATSSCLRRSRPGETGSLQGSQCSWSTSGSLSAIQTGPCLLSQLYRQAHVCSVSYTDRPMSAQSAIQTGPMSTQSAVQTVPCLHSQLYRQSHVCSQLYRQVPSQSAVQTGPITVSCTDRSHHSQLYRQFRSKSDAAQRSQYVCACEWTVIKLCMMIPYTPRSVLMETKV